MNLSIGIKNAILFLLCILILHFLIKNVLLDKKPDSGLAGPVKGEQDKGYFETFLPEFVNKNSNDKAVQQDAENQRMMEYVNSNKPTEIDFAFDQKLITPCEPKKCLEPRKDDMQLPLSTTCDADIGILKDDSMKIKADCHLPQQHQNFTLIKEYENEKVINGGALYEGLGINAFDTFNDYYSGYIGCASAAS